MGSKHSCLFSSKLKIVNLYLNQTNGPSIGATAKYFYEIISYWSLLKTDNGRVFMTHSFLWVGIFQTQRAGGVLRIGVIKGSFGVGNFGKYFFGWLDLCRDILRYSKQSKDLW